ncbi:MAG: L-threonylcarbamoyladenylate synthase [Phormidesmis sp. RL_2_1]|nr:L-threonylcarbamoyladenylate synthase [Phormidesmis sp. RL_2_1]
MPQLPLRQLLEEMAHQPKLVSFPTDTVPALAARPEHAELIYAAKRRPPEKPLILMGASLIDLLPYVAGSPHEQAIWQAVVRQHWPGQLTLVLPASAIAPKTLNPQTSTPQISKAQISKAQTSHGQPAGTQLNTLGIRVPNHPVALELLSHTGPLATTSANISGQPPLTSWADITQTFPDILTPPVDTFEQADEISGQPSTVIKWTGDDWQVLRQGKVKL